MNRFALVVPLAAALLGTLTGAARPAAAADGEARLLRFPTTHGDKIAFTYARDLCTVPAAGGVPEPLPLPRGGFASYSPDGKQLAFNRVFREFRTWKRYRGGMADDVWLYDFATKKTEQLTDDPASDIIPMWAGGKIYFLSDRGPEKRFNLYSLDPKTKETTRHTNFTEFDIKFPSAGENA